MVFATETSELSSIEVRPDAIMRLPLGVASPLWGFYAGAALTGVAYWWMTQWARPVNLEALFGVARELPAVPPALETLKAGVEEVVDTLADTELPRAPLGGESAPIAPIVAAESATPEPARTVEKPAAAAPVAKDVPAPAPEPRSVAPKAKAEPRPNSV